MGAEAAPRRFRSNARLQRIKNYRWEVGRASPELLARMSPAEREFLETYETLLGEYDLQEDGSFLDLFGPGAIFGRPPGRSSTGIPPDCPVVPDALLS